MVIKFLIILVFVPNFVWAQTVQEFKQELNAKYKTEEQKLLKAMNNGEEIDSSKFSKGFKEVHFNLFKAQAHEIGKSDKAPSPEMIKEFNSSEDALSALEFEEGKVDQVSEKVNQHLKNEAAQEYKKDVLAFIDYLSWQQNVTLKSPSGSKTLIVTNKGYCGGAGYGKQNAKYHFFGDACFLYGRGDVSAQDTGVTYHQRDVYAIGGKISLGAGMFVSSAKAEVGFKLPLLYSNQTFNDPSQSSFPGTKVSQPSPVQTFATLYTRWPFDKWFFQTEFGKMLGKDLTLWSLGVGYKF